MDKCQKTKGMYWDSMSCKTNVCKCGNDNGAMGTGCPSNGAPKCTAEQRGRCSSLLCPAGYKPKASAEAIRCSDKQPRCDKELDLATCCDSIKYTNRFWLRIRTRVGNGCGTNSWVWGKLESRDTGASTGWRTMDKP